MSSTLFSTFDQKPVAKPGLPAALIAAVAFGTGYHLSFGNGDLAFLSPLCVSLFCLLRFRDLRGGFWRCSFLGLALGAIVALAVMPSLTNLVLSYVTVAAFAHQTSPGEIRLINGLLRYAASIFKAIFFNTVGLPIAGFRFLKNLHGINGALKMRDLVLPVSAIAAFSLLLGVVNPIIESALYSLSLRPLESLLQSAFIWSSALISIFLIAISLSAEIPISFGDQFLSRRLPGESLVGIRSVCVTLFALNALFLVQNLTDATYLWSGQVLPDHMTYAEYAHRGAYTLIGTTLLAAALIVFVMRPNSENERSPMLRFLVFAWIAQNMFLVVSTGLRIMNYVDAYGWTPLRIDVLIFLALVTVGFVLLGLRLLHKKESIWLIEANTWSAMLILIAAGFFNLSQVSYRWNQQCWLTQADFCTIHSMLPAAPSHEIRPDGRL